MPSGKTHSSVVWLVTLGTKISHITLTLCVPCIILQCVDKATRCTILVINFFYSTIFLSALHVSNESSRSSSGALPNILYHAVWYNRAGESSCFEDVGKTGLTYNFIASRFACTIVPIVQNCVIQYSMPCLC